jgi:TolB protein
MKYDAEPIISPDGKRIIFSSNMDDWHEDIKKFGHNFDLYLINPKNAFVQ